MATELKSLKKEENFNRVRKTGRFWRGRLIRLTFLTTSEPQARLGISVSKKVSNKAVVRNKLRRRVRAIVQKIFRERAAADMVISLTNEAAGASFEELQDEITKAFEVFNKETG